MKPVTKLAETLKALANNGQKVDDIAGSILKLSREFGTVKRFSEAVREAYTANNWHSGRGRPTKDAKASEKTPVPATVKTYVWEVRRALAAGLRVYNYNTFYELRRAVAAHQMAETRRMRHQAPKDPALAGVHVAHPDKFTGHLLHDLVVTMAKLGNGERREHLEAGLKRLLTQYAPAKAKMAMAKVEAHAAANDTGKTAKAA